MTGGRDTSGYEEGRERAGRRWRASEWWWWGEKWRVGDSADSPTPTEYTEDEEEPDTELSTEAEE